MYIGSCYENIGKVCYDKGLCEEALEAFEKAMRIKRKNVGPDNSSIGVLLNCMGLAYDKLGRYNEAMKHY